MPHPSRTPIGVDATRGCVWFVGAGPGHPDLITARGLDRLARADCVVHDTLVTEALLDSAAVGAERIVVSRDGADADPGVTTGRLLADLAMAGRKVVRLKGGDPAVFGRLAEELRPVREAGIPYEIVPGVTAMLAAAAAAGVPLTSRSTASHLTLLTGHEADEKASSLDLAALAALPGTLAVYMGVGRAAEWAARLVAAGRPTTTPVTIVSRCSWPDQRIATTTLGGCAEAFAIHHWPSPAVIIVGDVAEESAGPPALPLAGKRILLTRPAGQADELATAIAMLGGESLHVPVVEIVPPDSWEPFDTAIRQAGTFDWIVFASVNGVESFLARLRAARLDARALGTARLAAIGTATARRLDQAGLVCDLTPGISSSEGIVAALLPTIRAGRILLIRADRGRDVMRREFEAAGHEVNEVAAYSSRPVTTLDAATLARLESTPVDWVTITSGAIAESAARLFGDRMRSWRIASLSPITSAVLRGLGLPPQCEASDASAAALAAAIARFQADRPVVPAEPTDSSRPSRST